MAGQHQHYRSPFGDTTFTKVFVGGLAWETPNDVMRSYFQQFGDILEAVIITDKHTGKSKGYGFVTFRDPESAQRACAEPNPVIDGRRANCNVASFGRPRPSPPRGRNQMGNIYQGGGIVQGGSSSSYPALPPTLPQPPVPPSPPVIYPSYGYTPYSHDYGYHQTMYNPHVQQAPYYNQLYGASPSTMAGSYYGYSLQGARGTFYVPPAAQRYLYYPAQPQLESGSSSAYPPAPPQPLPLLHQPRVFPSSTDTSVPPQTSTETEADPATSTSSTA